MEKLPPVFCGIFINSLWEKYQSHWKKKEMLVLRNITSKVWHESLKFTCRKLCKTQISFRKNEKKDTWDLTYRRKEKERLGCLSFVEKEVSVQNTKDEIPLLPTATFQPSQSEMRRHNLFYHQIKSNTSIFYFTGSSVANPEIRQNR